MEALLKRYYTKIQYFVGSIMSITDLQRVQVNRHCLLIKEDKHLYSRSVVQKT